MSVRSPKAYVPLAIVAAAVAALLLWGVDESTSNVATTSAKHGEFLIDIEAQGEIHAVQSRGVTRPRGRWSRSQIVNMVPEGSVVEEGAFLIQFDTSESERRVEEKRNELLNAEAELKSHDANNQSKMAELDTALRSQQYSYEQANIRYEQMEYEAEIRRREAELDLRKAELTLQEASDRIESQKVIAEAERSRAELKVAQAQAEFEQAEESLGEQTITAPVGGLVVYKEMWSPEGPRKIKIGDTPWPGMELIELPDLSQMQVRTQVNEVDIHRIEVDQAVLVEVDAMPDSTFQGRISRVATLAKRKGNSDVKVFDVEVLLNSTSGQLRPGMTANCSIVTNRLVDVVYIPLEAVFEKDGKTVVYIGGGRPSPKEVVLGPKNSDHVVVEEGLSEGDEVCLRDPTVPLEEIGGETPPTEPAER